MAIDLVGALSGDAALQEADGPAEPPTSEPVSFGDALRADADNTAADEGADPEQNEGQGGTGAGSNGSGSGSAGTKPAPTAAEARVRRGKRLTAAEIETLSHPTTGETLTKRDRDWLLRIKRREKKATTPADKRRQRELQNRLTEWRRLTIAAEEERLAAELLAAERQAEHDQAQAQARTPDEIRVFVGNEPWKLWNGICAMCAAMKKPLPDHLLFTDEEMERLKEPTKTLDEHFPWLFRHLQFPDLLIAAFAVWEIAGPRIEFCAAVLGSKTPPTIEGEVVKPRLEGGAAE